MNLINLFFFTQSILAIILSIFIIGLIVVLIVILRGFNEIKNKFEDMADESLHVANEVKNMTKKVGKTIVDYFVIKIVDGIYKKRERRNNAK